MAEKNPGLELASRFSYITNKLRYCGPREAFQDMNSLLSSKNADTDKIKENLKKYEGLYVYLDKIASKTSRDPFSYEVIEAYWLGNSLLNEFQATDMASIIKGLVDRGLPKDYAQRLIPVPPGATPHHSFHVLYIGAGRTTRSIPTNIQTMGKCLVLPATVLKIQERQLVVLKQGLVEEGGFKLKEPKIDYITYEPSFLKGIKEGDTVAVHWDFACKILKEQEKMNLLEFTNQNMVAINSAWSFSSD